MRAPLVGPERAQVLCTCSFLRKPESRLHKVCNAGKALRAHRPLLFRASSFPRRASPWPVSLFTHPIHADACSSSARRIASHRIASPRSAFHLITFAAALRLVATPRSASRNSRLPARRCRFQIPDIKLTSQPTPPALRGRHLFPRGSALHWSGFRRQTTPHRLACLAPV